MKDKMLRARGTRRARTAGATIAVVGALSALTGGALAGEHSNPSPGCRGVAFTDPANDHRIGGPAGLGPPRSPRNLDLLSGFFLSGDQGVTANIQVAWLDKTVAPGTTGTAWALRFANGEETYFVAASVDFGGGVYFSYGRYQRGWYGMGETTGKLFEGPDGIVQLAVPPALAKEGATLGAPQGFTLNIYHLLSSAAEADSSSPSKAHKITRCGSGAPPAPPAVTAPPATSSGPPAVRPRPHLSATIEDSARRVNKTRKVTVRIRSREAYTKVALQLVRGKRVFATRRLVTLAGGVRNVPLTIKRALSAGRYRLDIAATDHAGVRAVGSFDVQLSR